MPVLLSRLFDRKWKLALKVAPLVALILLLKFAAHSLRLEFLSLSPIFTAIISANIFLIGFLITGVLSDYKESEKLPGDLACSLETISDEALVLHAAGKRAEAADLLGRVSALAAALGEWFHKRERTGALLERLAGLNACFLALEKATQPNFITRLKQEQHQLRRMITRIHTIRETSFSEAGYAIAEIITFILSVGLVFVRIDPFYESAFFVAFVSFMLIYMVLLIKDLDNPFGYYEEEDLSEEVSLKPLEDFRARLAARPELAGGGR